MLDWLYPPKCIVCLKLLPVTGPRGFCADCANALTELAEPACRRCGRPCAENAVCECNGQDIGVEKNRSVYIYDSVMSDTIHAFKYHNHPAHGRVLGRIMGERLTAGFDEAGLIVPVPMFKPKQHLRGYNQSEILAREIARVTGIAYDNRALVRIRQTKPQSELSANERRSNLAQAFKTTRPLTGSILLVDDIYTTGSTLKECAETLLAAGAARVYGYTLAAAVL